VQHDYEAAVGLYGFRRINFKYIGLFVDDDFIDGNGGSPSTCAFPQLDPGVVKMAALVLELFWLADLQF